MIRISTLCLLALVSFNAYAQKFQPAEIRQWTERAQRVSIVRDQWGIPHVYGKTDADAVFGFLYAQCEDDFRRVEMNYIIATARVAEVEGEAKLMQDLRMRLFYDTLQAIEWYRQSPEWLRQLCDAFAGGVNYYLYTHPEVKPKLITRFQPWMPLLFSEGSIGGDIESVSLPRLKAFYDAKSGSSIDAVQDLDPGAGPPEPSGSNGFAIAPAKTASGHALFMINPHTSFYFRPEVHVVSEEGLNAYGAVTWGQFFIYQGFNEHCGWMHTTSQADVIDEYLETVIKKDNAYFLRYGQEEVPFQVKRITIKYKDGATKKVREFITYHSQHGPVIGRENEKWVTLSMMREPVKALSQSYLRTKSKGLADFKKAMEFKANSSNNTVYADDQGNIAYWHGNFMPRRNAGFDWSKPLDGSNPATAWQGLHEVNEIVQQLNPANGWIQNCNSTPFTVSGEFSPKKDNYPTYMAPDEENPRGINAQRVLSKESSFTLEKLIKAAYDPHLVVFETLIPALVQAYDGNATPEQKKKLEGPISMLRTWDYNFQEQSIPTTLAIYWGQELRQLAMTRANQVTGMMGLIQYMENETTPKERLEALEKMVDELTRDYGTWQVGWGEVNRYQRLTGEINESYDDARPSLPVAFASSFWGSLASFGSKKFPGTKKMYGYGGNSFVAAVEFGPRIRAKSILAGGNSNDPRSPYFTNQADLYSKGEFKDVLFYKEDVMKAAVRQYQPGK